MFKRILVPLDGSRLSEASLGAALAMAQRFGSSITLLHVIERDAPEEVHREPHLTTAEGAGAYLHEVATRPVFTKIHVKTHVHSEPVSQVANSIVEHAQIETPADLIVTCTHGSGGIRDLLFGSIAQRVVSQGQLPLLLIRPDQPDFDPKSVLVPLDPDSLHDESFEPAVAIAAAFKAHLQLLSVIPTIETMTGEEAATSSLLPMTAKVVLDLREQEADEHLRQHTADLERKGLVVNAWVARGDPPTQIVRHASTVNADLVVLSTHRKAGLEAFWSKSVAPRVAQATKIPLLMLPLA